MGYTIKGNQFILGEKRPERVNPGGQKKKKRNTNPPVGGRSAAHLKKKEFQTRVGFKIEDNTQGLDNSAGGSPEKDKSGGPKKEKVERGGSRE